MGLTEYDLKGETEEALAPVGSFVEPELEVLNL